MLANRNEVRTIEYSVKSRCEREKSLEVDQSRLKHFV